MNDNNNFLPGCMSWLGLVQIILLIAKIVNLLDWSWWLVFVPLMVACLGLIFFTVIGLLVIWRNA